MRELMERRKERLSCISLSLFDPQQLEVNLASGCSQRCLSPVRGGSVGVNTGSDWHFTEGPWPRAVLWAVREGVDLGSSCHFEWAWGHLWASCEWWLLHLLGFNSPSLCKAASLSCCLIAIPTLLWAEFTWWSFILCKEEPSLGGEPSPGRMQGRGSFRLQVLGEKHPQLVGVCVAAVPPHRMLCQDRLVRWLQITGCPGQAAVLDYKGTAGLVGE